MNNDKTAAAHILEAIEAGRAQRAVFLAALATELAARTVVPVTQDPKVDALEMAISRLPICSDGKVGVAEIVTILLGSNVKPGVSNKCLPKKGQFVVVLGEDFGNDYVGNGAVYFSKVGDYAHGTYMDGGLSTGGNNLHAGTEFRAATAPEILRWLEMADEAEIECVAADDPDRYARIFDIG